MKTFVLLLFFTSIAQADPFPCRWAIPQDSTFSLFTDSLEQKILTSCDTSGKTMLYRGLATCQTETLSYQEIRQCVSTGLVSFEAGACQPPTKNDFSAVSSSESSSEGSSKDSLRTADSSNEMQLENMQCRWASEPEVSDEKLCGDRFFAEGTVVCGNAESPEFSFNTSCLTETTSMSEMATACAKEGIYGWSPASAQLRLPASDDE